MNRNLWLLALCQGLFLTNNVDCGVELVGGSGCDPAGVERGGAEERGGVVGELHEGGGAGQQLGVVHDGQPGRAHALVGEVAGVSGRRSVHAGLWLELDAILAVVIGGTSLMGGRFSIPMAVLGAMIIQAMNTGILISGFSPEFNLVVKSAVIIVILVLQSPLSARLFRRLPGASK